MKIVNFFQILYILLNPGLNNKKAYLPVSLLMFYSKCTTNYRLTYTVRNNSDDDTFLILLCKDNVGLCSMQKKMKTGEVVR